MPEKPYLLLDAGGTVVFPNQDILIQLAKENKINLTHSQLYRGYYELIYRFDTEPEYAANPWPEGYTQALLDLLGVWKPKSRILALAADDLHGEKSLWTFTFPWVYETLSRLFDEGYRMSILSNSDGRAKQIFEELKLTQYFEHIFDSDDLGCEKPDPRIFNTVRKELDLHPSEVLYIGDIYRVDVLGANQARIGGIHIDPLRLYRNFPGIHLDDIRLLESWLSIYIKHPKEFTAELFPKSGKKKDLSENPQIYSQDAKLPFSKILQLQ